MAEITRFVVAVAVFIFQDERFLALRRCTSAGVAPGAWDVVSGKVERGESPYKAAQREAYEETGMTVALDARPITAYQAAYGAEPMAVLVYRGKGLSQEIRLSREHDAKAWVTGEEFSQLCPFAELTAAARQAAEIPW